MGMNIQKSAGVKADTFILKRNNMDRWIRMDVAMLIILAICTRLVAGIMNVEKMDAYTGSGEGFCKAVSESHGVDMVKDCFELGTQKVLDVKKTAKSVCKSVTIKKTMQDVIRPTETEEIIPEVKGVPEAKDGKAAWANMDSAKTETITQETVTDKSVPESITGKITEEPAGEPMTEDLLNLEGFKVNSEGVIEGYENLDLIPSSTLMSSIEYELFTKWQREFILRKCLQKIRESEAYDYILIDAPPTLGGWVMNILCASDQVIIPVEASPWGMFGLANMFEFLNEVKQISPELEVAGIAVTKVDTRKSYYKQTMDTLHELENIHVFEQVIRVDSAIEWSQDNSIPVVEYKKSSRSAKEYTQLAEEVMEHVSR